MRTAVFGPRTSCIRTLLGEVVTQDDVMNDPTEWGSWSNYDELAYRPPELWAELIHDHVWNGE